jgi:hypothetical protein
MQQLAGALNMLWGGLSRRVDYQPKRGRGHADLSILGKENAHARWPPAKIRYAPSRRSVGIGIFDLRYPRYPRAIQRSGLSTLSQHDPRRSRPLICRLQICTGRTGRTLHRPTRAQPERARASRAREGGAGMAQQLSTGTGGQQHQWLQVCALCLQSIHKYTCTCTHDKYIYYPGNDRPRGLGPSMVAAREACCLVSKGRASVVLIVAEAPAWYLIHPYDERNLYLYLTPPLSPLACRFCF